MDKQEYLKYKSYIKTLSKPSIDSLCEQVGVTDTDRELLYHLGENRTRTHSCLKLGYSVWLYNKSLKRIFIRLDDYLKRTSK